MDDTSFIFRISAGERDNKMCSNISRGSSDNDIGFIGQTVWVVGEGCRRRNLALRFFSKFEPAPIMCGITWPSPAVLFAQRPNSMI